MTHYRYGYLAQPAYALGMLSMVRVLNDDIPMLVANLKQVILRLGLALCDIIPASGQSAQYIKCAALRRLGIRIGKYSNINFGFRCISPQNVDIGDYVWLGHENRIWAYSEVSIGERTMTARAVSIISASHDTDSFEPLKGQSVRIGRGCWIGANAILLGGTIIGDGAVIGAGALVKGTIPPWAVAVGTPAKVVRYRTPPARIWSDFGYYASGRITGE